jgi:hypothetical protein
MVVREKNIHRSTRIHRMAHRPGRLALGDAVGGDGYGGKVFLAQVNDVGVPGVPAGRAGSQ